MGVCAWVCFFFQAEDGIRDGHVTGVQTCALPICRTERGISISFSARHCFVAVAATKSFTDRSKTSEIGRASCREREETAVGGGRARKRNSEKVGRVGVEAQEEVGQRKRRASVGSP